MSYSSEFCPLPGEVCNDTFSVLDTPVGFRPSCPGGEDLRPSQEPRPVTETAAGQGQNPTPEPPVKAWPGSRAFTDLRLASGCKARGYDRPDIAEHVSECP